MVRRPSRALHTLYTSRRARTTSRADGPGMLYAFVDPGRRWKIGMTSNFRRRRAQWNRQCPCPGRRWMPPMAVKRRRRAETIALNKAQRNLSIHRKPVKRVEEYHSTPAVSGCKGVRILQVMYVGVTDSCARITLHLRGGANIPLVLLLLMSILQSAQSIMLSPSKTDLSADTGNGSCFRRVVGSETSIIVTQDEKDTLTTVQRHPGIIVDC
ncbi:hypothetical protein F5878DRAFT_644893 [Lentinula raphanica]|uniref:GIY-YIG domain-containing protein n=1 Tax=Lentinula raphanica TaxID=153919 RepID=A0AA38U999_9AGAR|nr:hypothetical protein F5878DRAFT_644893 [Lentinula raphanica]